MEAHKPKNFRQICKNKNTQQKFTNQYNQYSFVSKSPIPDKSPCLFRKMSGVKSPNRIIELRQHQKTEKQVASFTINNSELSFQKIGSNQRFLSPSAKISHQTDSGTRQSGSSKVKNSFQSIVNSKTSALNAFSSNKKFAEQASINQVQESIFNFSIPSIDNSKTTVNYNIKEKQNYMHSHNEGASLIKNQRKRLQNQEITFKSIIDKKACEVQKISSNLTKVNAKAQTSRKNLFNFSRSPLADRKVLVGNQNSLDKHSVLVKKKSYADSQRQAFTARKYDRQTSLSKLKEKQKLLGLKKHISAKQTNTIQIEPNSRIVKSNSSLGFIKRPIIRKPSELQRINQSPSLSNESIYSKQDNKGKRKQIRIDMPIKQESRTSFNSDFVNQSIQSQATSQLDMNPHL